jgi:hypothetical protein
MQQDTETFSSVISLDPYQHTYIVGASGHLQEESALEYSKKQYVISYINTKGFISTVVSVSKNIPDEDLKDVIENKVYEELALDMAIAYQTNYIEMHNRVDENNRFFQVFVVDPLTLEDDFKPIVEKIKYIDQIVPLPLLIKSLYAKEIIDDTGLHCFIFFQQNDAFLTIYNEREFVYTKSLSFSLTTFHEEFCALLGEQISFNAFIDILSSEGLATSNLEHQKYLIKLFSDAFLHVNDILTYVKRAFQLDKIDTIYIGSEIADISGLDEYAQTYLSINSYSFDFDYGFSSDLANVSQIQSLMQLYTTVPQEDRYECNFSTFHRPPPFTKRESGKLIILAAASIVLALIYPITNWSLAYIENVRYSLLHTQYTTVHHQKMTREATMHLKQRDKKRIATLEKAEETEYNNKKSTLIKIHNIKVNYPMKAKNLTHLTQVLNKFGVQLKEIEYEQQNHQKYFTMTLLSRYNKKITELVKYLTKTDAGQYSFSLKNIDYDTKDNYYTSKLKVTLL